MKLHEGPAFGGIILGIGLGYLLANAGHPLWLAIAGGVMIAVTDYVLLVWLKSKGIKK